MKALSVICGIGLLILWLVGLGSPNSTTWLAWWDAIAAVAAFIAAGSANTRQNAVAGAGVVALGIFVLWIVGLSTNGTPWQNWWTFAFACLMVVSAFAGTSIPTYRIESTSADRRSQEEAERNRFRKGA